MFVAFRRVLSYNSALSSNIAARSIQYSAPRLGIKDFFDPVPVGDDALTTGRAWTVPDLRRKVLK